MYIYVYTYLYLLTSFTVDSSGTEGTATASMTIALVDDTACCASALQLGTRRHLQLVDLVVPHVVDRLFPFDVAYCTSPCRRRPASVPIATSFVMSAVYSALLVSAKQPVCVIFLPLVGAHPVVIDAAVRQVAVDGRRQAAPVSSGDPSVII